MRHINYIDQWGKMLTPEIVLTDMNMWMRIKKTIDQINANAVA